jgi:hypothetical protein
MTTIPNPDNESGVLTLFRGFLATIANLPIRMLNQITELNNVTFGDCNTLKQHNVHMLIRRCQLVRFIFVDCYHCYHCFLCFHCCAATTATAATITTISNINITVSIILTTTINILMTIIINIIIIIVVVIITLVTITIAVISAVLFTPLSPSTLLF